MLKRLSFIIIALSILLFAFQLIGKIYWVDQTTIAEYRKIVQVDKSLKSPPKDLKGDDSIRQQNRVNVTKDIWRILNQQRLHGFLSSAESQIVTTAETEQVLEQLKDVTIWLQQELYYRLPNDKEGLLQSNGKILMKNGNPEDPNAWFKLDKRFKPMQKVDLIQAEAAIYHISSNRLVAYNVKLYRYLLPTHTLPTNNQHLEPIMVGTTAKLELSLLDSEGWSFKANQLKTTFYSPKGMF
ncbi:MAG: hypothetical protein K0S74_622 [Chlamydiales bacterium]|jgi:hypothetical protein|nr:hypothetical protein [Chlamydiales bacterium]